MRRVLLPALMIALALLSGCAGGKEIEERFTLARQELAGASELSFTAELTADMGETVFTCTLACVRDAEGTEMTVLSPDLAQGVVVHSDGAGAKLSYDGLELCVGEMGGVTPVGAVPMLTGALLDGYAEGFYTETYEDTPALVARIYISEDTHALFWLEEENLTPLYAELVHSGTAVVRCRFSDFRAPAQEKI